MITQTERGLLRQAQVARGGPAQEPRRVASIDVLRGFALFGILLIHVPIFASPGAPPGLERSGPWLDRGLVAGLILLVEAKFFSLFSMLFGLGFAIQHRSAERRGVPFAPRFRRRLLVLGVFGALHAALLWEGDILLVYAVVGLLLIPLRAAPPARLLRWAARLLLIPLTAYGLALTGLTLARQHPPSAAMIRAGEQQFSAGFAAARADVTGRYAGADPAAAVAGRVEAYARGLPLLLVRVPVVLAMFLVGFAAGRLRLVEESEHHLALLRRVRRCGLALGLAASLLVTVAYQTMPPFAAMTALGMNQALAGPVLALGYAAAVVLLARDPAWRRRLAPLAAYGRVALSGYLLQSAVCALIFYGTGLGLVGKVSPTQAILLALLINAALIALSAWWLARFRAGPAEWLWRSLTEGAPQPLRRAPVPAE